jgi:hypothetical protein
MKSICLFLFLISVYYINALGSNSTTLTHQDGLSGTIAWDGLRKIAPWRPKSGQSSIANRHIMPLWTAGHRRRMSQTGVPSSQPNITNSTLEESRLINDFVKEKSFMQEIYTQPTISLHEMEKLDKRYELGLNATS